MASKLLEYTEEMSPLLLPIGFASYNTYITHKASKLDEGVDLVWFGLAAATLAVNVWSVVEWMKNSVVGMKEGVFDGRSKIASTLKALVAFTVIFHILAFVLSILVIVATENNYTMDNLSIEDDLLSGSYGDAIRWIGYIVLGIGGITVLLSLMKTFGFSKTPKIGLGQRMFL